MKVGILNYGAGNLRNVYRAVNYLGFEYIDVKKCSDFNNLDKLIIPGVGAFKVAMNQLHDNNLIESINDFSHEGMPIMGICLGMQLLFSKSLEFGHSDGLDLIKGSVEHIRDQYELKSNSRIKVPHVGWSSLEFINNDKIYGAETDKIDCYFVHSFMACNVPNENILAMANYSNLKIPALVKIRNTYGFQFHPEKSGKHGLEMIKKFMEYKF